jgi:hypothetical protein
MMFSAYWNCYYECKPILALKSLVARCPGCLTSNNDHTQPFLMLTARRGGDRKNQRTGGKSADLLLLHHHHRRRLDRRPADERAASRQSGEPLVPERDRQPQESRADFRSRRYPLLSRVSPLRLPYHRWHRLRFPGQGEDQGTLGTDRENLVYGRRRRSPHQRHQSHASRRLLLDTKHGTAVAGVKMLIGAAIGKTLDDSIEGTLRV